MKADKYYGREATEYDAARCHSLRWAKEQQAVADFVFSGPVLDVPIGTGRYVSIYRQKGLEVVGLDRSTDMLAEARRNYPDLVLHHGDVRSLPFRDEQFGTVVCTRLLDWLYPDEMRQAVAELRRVANLIVVTIRHGTPGERVNYTHDLASFYEAIDGLFIEQRRVTEETQDGTEEIFRLRLPTWADALKPFAYPDSIFHMPEDEINRLASEWTGRFWPRSITVTQESARVRSCYPTGAELGAVLDGMIKFDPRYETSLRPRHRTSAPATLLKVGEWTVVLDGRRRINQWRNQPGRFPALMIEVPQT